MKGKNMMYLIIQETKFDNIDNIFNNNERTNYEQNKTKSRVQK